MFMSRRSFLASAVGLVGANFLRPFDWKPRRKRSDPYAGPYGGTY